MFVTYSVILTHCKLHVCDCHNINYIYIWQYITTLLCFGKIFGVILEATAFNVFDAPCQNEAFLSKVFSLQAVFNEEA